MKIAIMGLGVVGRGVYDIITSRFAPEIEVKTILDLLPLEELHCIHAKSIDEIVNDPEIELVVEAMGGLHPASDFVLKALRAGKHVVTPNKQMVSTIFAELQQAAAENGVKILFTPSAGGGIPWLYNLVRTKRCGGIEAFRGIINGTTNFILDSMEKSGADFADILKRRSGWATRRPIPPPTSTASTFSGNAPSAPIWPSTFSSIPPGSTRPAFAGSQGKISGPSGKTACTAACSATEKSSRTERYARTSSRSC